MPPGTPDYGRARAFSLIGVLLVAGFLTAFLFRDVEAVRIELTPTTEEGAASPHGFAASIVVPQGQRLPVGGVTLVIEHLRPAPAVVDIASCWGEVACGEGLRHAGPGPAVVASLRLVEKSAEPTVGPLWVRIEGYGPSPVEGYGAEVESERRLEASDFVDQDGRGAHGLGYGGAVAAFLRYEAGVETDTLSAGDYQVTFVVETGSRSMGSISSAHLPLRIERTA